MVHTKDPTDSSLHVDRQRDRQSRSVSGRLPTEAQNNNSTLEMPASLSLSLSRSHRKKNRFLLPTNLNYWLHWIHDKIADTYLSQYQDPMIP